MIEVNVLPLVKHFCPICLAGPKICCADMKRCPLALIKFEGAKITPEEFARQHSIEPQMSAPAVEVQPPTAEANGQFSLF